MAVGLVPGASSVELSLGLSLATDRLESQNSQTAVRRKSSSLKRKRTLSSESSSGNRRRVTHDQAEYQLHHLPPHDPSSQQVYATSRRISDSSAGLETQRTRSLSSSISGASHHIERDVSDCGSVTSEQSTQTMPIEKPSQFQGTHIGASVELEPLLLDLAPGHSTQSGEIYQNFNGTPFLLPKKNSQRVRGSNLDDLSMLDQMVGDLGPALIDAYFKNVHFNFPVVGTEFFRLHKRGDRRHLSSVLTAAIYTVSIPWLPSDLSDSFAASSNAQALEQLAFNGLSRHLPNPDLSVIQAGLLLMQQPNVNTKALNSQLVAAAYELGLQVDCTSWEISASERGLRKRLAWALYIQDKWCALIHGRPSAISTSNWVVKDLSEDDFDMDSTHDNPSYASGYRLYMQLVALTNILSMVLDTFYTLKAIEEVNEAAQNGTRLVLDRAKPSQLKLKDWFSNLPASLKMDASMDERPSAVGCLHLAYFATEITLHRCIIRSLQSSGNDPYLSHICRSAAKTRLISSMDFVNRLRRDHLEAFWYFPSRNSFALIGTFGSLLLATAPGQEEADFYSVRLNEYRWTLAVSSRSAQFLASAVESLDHTEKLLENLPPKPRTSDMAAPQPQQPRYVSVAESPAEDMDEDDEDEELEDGV